MPRVKKTPAFPMYGKDAFDDEAFNGLPLGSEGLFWRLAWWQWSEGSIPADIEKILDKMPRKKVPEVRRYWPALRNFFAPIGDGSRLQNATVELRRDKQLGERGRRVLGANITNKKLGRRTSSDSLTGTLSVPGSDTLRAASASASAFPPSTQPTKKPEGVQGEGRAAPVMVTAERLMLKLEHCGLKVIPTPQVVVAWVTEYGEELVVETLADCENDYRGKHFRYLESILTNRRDNPHERPGNRRGKRAVDRGSHGAGSDRPKPRNFA
jgi:hypothetical protein